MTMTAVDNLQVIREYMVALSGQAKTEAIVSQFVIDPALKEHIRQAEAAFPLYRIDVAQLVGEGETVALRGMFHGVHKGEFAGVPATGRAVSADLMLFYRLEDAKIVEHWMVLDTAALMGQLTVQG
jgi:predicted ester cyclase